MGISIMVMSVKHGTFGFCLIINIWFFFLIEMHKSMMLPPRLGTPMFVNEVLHGSACTIL